MSTTTRRTAGNMTDDLVQALHTAEFTVSSLRAAIADADPVEGLVLLPLIARGESLAHDVRVLLRASELSRNVPA